VEHSAGRAVETAHRGVLLDVLVPEEEALDRRREDALQPERYASGASDDVRPDATADAAHPSPAVLADAGAGKSAAPAPAVRAQDASY